MATIALGAPQFCRKRLRITNGYKTRAQPINERVEIEECTMATPLRLAICPDGIIIGLQCG